MSSSAVPLGLTNGAELLATLFSAALWGTTCMQTAVYFIQCPKDRLPLKSLVVWLWVVDTVHQMLLVEGVYKSQILDFCDLSVTATVLPEYLWQVLLTTFVAIPSQVFFTYRIWRFTGKQWIYWAILAPICLFEMAGGLAFIAFGTITPTAAELVSTAPASIFTATQAVAAGADLTIAAGLMILLIRSRGHALKRSRSVLQKLLIITLNTGLWTALFAIFTFISIIAFKNTLIYAALYFPLCPLYCNTVLANLNARELLKPGSLMSEGGMSSSTYHLEPVFATPRGAAGALSSLTFTETALDKSLGRSEDDAVKSSTRGNKLDLERQ